MLISIFLSYLILNLFIAFAQGVIDFSRVADTGNYTCDELVRWLTTEKHYSNPKRNIIFNFLINKDCSNQPIIQIPNVNFGSKSIKERTFFLNEKISNSPKCNEHDENALIFLSNFSINHNFSHFLHGLLRLFCALIDSRFIVWDKSQGKFIQAKNYTIWLDENLILSSEMEIWIKSLGNIRYLNKVSGCVSSNTLTYGSGCVRLLPPEKWFGYPGCRAGNILLAFGTYMRNKYMAANPESLNFIDNLEKSDTSVGLRVAFAVRDVGAETGRREISNLNQVQYLIKKTQHVKSSMENVTFEHLDVPSTIRYMAGVHIFISVHGAGMTNMFFMNPGAAVVEIIPFPLCSCKSPDYFYGIGGYYHGSAIAQGLKHYHYCVPASDVKWHKRLDDIRSGGRCSWKHLHAVDSVVVDPAKFVSLMRKVERDLIASGTIQLTKPIIQISPHANG